jgi:hypothetical protein
MSFGLIERERVLIRIVRRGTGDRRDAVDHVERLTVRGDRVGAADADRETAARRAVVLGDLRAGDAPFEHLPDVRVTFVGTSVTLTEETAPVRS